MVLHILLFFVMFIVALVIPPERRSATFVFTTFINQTGWKEDGIAWLLGLLSSAFVMIGETPIVLFGSMCSHYQSTDNKSWTRLDAGMHLSEEMEDPRTQVPRAMVGSIGFNGILGFGMLLALLFGLGDIDAALASPTGYPIVEIFYWMTRQNGAATNALMVTPHLLAGHCYARSDRILIWDYLVVCT